MRFRKKFISLFIYSIYLLTCELGNLKIVFIRLAMFSAAHPPEKRSNLKLKIIGVLISKTWLLRSHYQLILFFFYKTYLVFFFLSKLMLFNGFIVVFFVL